MKSQSKHLLLSKTVPPRKSIILEEFLQNILTYLMVPPNVTTSSFTKNEGMKNNNKKKNRNKKKQKRNCGSLSCSFFQSCTVLPEMYYDH